MSAGHIRQRGPGAWELKYDIGRDPVTGKRRIRYKTVRGKKSDAQRELRNLLGAVDKGVVADSGKMTMGQWLKQWIEEARHTVSPKTHERYSEIVNKHLVPKLGAHQLAKLAPVHIQGFTATPLRAVASTAREGCHLRQSCTSIASLAWRSSGPGPYG